MKWPRTLASRLALIFFTGESSMNPVMGPGRA